MAAFPWRSRAPAMSGDAGKPGRPGRRRARPAAANRALALDAGGALRRGGHQRGFHAGLSRAAHPDGPAHAADEARVPHALYGVRPAAEAGSGRVVARRGAGRDARGACGGPGADPVRRHRLYFAALADGLAEIPDPGEAARAEARALLAERPGLTARAPGEGRPGDRGGTAPARRPAPGARLGGVARHRARPCRLAVGARRPGAGWSPSRHPARSAARRTARGHRRALRRHAGARRAGRGGGLLALGLDPALPAMRAHGVPELAAYLRGDIDLAEAGRRAVDRRPANTPSGRRPGSAIAVDAARQQCSPRRDA